MSYQLPPLVWLRAFEAAARHSSFTAAAEELNLTQSAVSHQVRSLEKHLGFPLFVRLARSVGLTDLGNAYLPPVRKAFEELSASTSGLFGTIGASSITVRAPVSYAVLWLAPLLKSFIDLHPNINIRLCSAVWADALADEKTDVDIQYGDGVWPGYDAEIIQNVGAIPVCLPEMWRGKTEEERLQNLAGENHIHVTGYENLWNKFFRAAQMPNVSGRLGLNVDTSLVALEMAAGGVGPAMVLTIHAEPYLKSGRLIRLTDVVVPQAHSHYFLRPKDSTHIRPEIMVFREWVMEQAGNT